MTKLEAHPTWVVAGRSYSRPEPTGFAKHPFSRIDHAFRPQGWIPQYAELYTLTVEFADLSNISALDRAIRRVIAAHLPDTAGDAVLRLERLVARQRELGQRMPDIGDVVQLLPETAAAILPTVALYYERPNERLEVVIHDLTTDAMAELYADLVLQEGTVTPTPLGRGYATGPAAVIATGDELVHATWSAMARSTSNIAEALDDASRQGAALLHAG